MSKMNIQSLYPHRRRNLAPIGVLLALTGCAVEEIPMEMVHDGQAVLDGSHEERHVDLADGLSLATSQAVQAAGPAQVPLVTFYSHIRGDYFTTSQFGWTCQYFRTCVEPPELDYVAIGLQGHVYNPDNPPPAGTVPLYHWWSANRGDNFLTTNPAWAGNVGDRRWEDGADYVLFRIEGHVRSTSDPQLFPLHSYWNPAVADNAAVASWRSGVPAGYGYYRTEGYLLPPESESLARCQANVTPYHTDNPSWQARGAYIDTWPAPADFFHGDAIRLTAPADWYQVDFWGTMKPVRGDFGSSGPAGFPAPGESMYALLGRVTSGRIFVSGRGWYEANRWFKALGDAHDWAGPCMFYDSTGVPPGEFQVGFNDSNISDNGGWANVTVQQWW
jgi:hypothetical protein